MKKPELLAPAGNMEKLKIALIYGADAVYLGGKSFGLRAFSDNFNNDEIIEAIEFAHNLNKKIYITINIIPHNDDLKDLPQFIHFIADAGADGVIVADLGVARLVKQLAPAISLHISTQANNTNWSSVLCWQDLGASRVVLARELSLKEISEIREKVNVELEAFVHGAMCISYSGRCLLSNYLTGRNANAGECAQACRWKYFLMEEKRPGQYIPVVEDERGTYIFNSKDLCMLPFIPELIACGLDSFKIEGRMKSVHYVATVASVYRQAIDEYFNDPLKFNMKPEWQEELEKISHRIYTTGFYFNKPTADDQIYSSNSYDQTHDFIGLVKSYDELTGMAVVEQRNNMRVGDIIEVMQPNSGLFSQRIDEMYDSEGQPIQVAPHPQQIVSIPMLNRVVEWAILRRRCDK